MPSIRVSNILLRYTTLLRRRAIGLLLNLIFGGFVGANSHSTKQHTAASLADVLEKDYFPMIGGAKLYLSEHEWRLIIAALRSDTAPSKQPCVVEATALRYAREFVDQPDVRAQAIVAFRSGGQDSVADALEEAVIIARELLRIHER